MPVWLRLILFCVLIVILIISGQFFTKATFNLDIKERIGDDRPVCCHYAVFTAEGDKELFFGIKYRTVKGLPLVSEYKRFFRKIYVFEKTTELCGVECKIVYYVGYEPEKEEDVFITPDGRKLLESFTNYGKVFNACT